MTKLILTKLIHTAIWLFMNVVIFYLLYAVLTNKIDKWVWICIGIVVVEGLVLLIFKGFCPLQLLLEDTLIRQKTILIFICPIG